MFTCLNNSVVWPDIWCAHTHMNSNRKANLTEQSESLSVVVQESVFEGSVVCSSQGAKTYLIQLERKPGTRSCFSPAQYVLVNYSRTYIVYVILSLAQSSNTIWVKTSVKRLKFNLYPSGTTQNKPCCLRDTVLGHEAGLSGWGQLMCPQNVCMDWAGLICRAPVIFFLLLCRI